MSNSRQLISSGSPFEATMGYSRAVVQEPFCFVSGTTGYDYANMTMPESAAEQARCALATIRKALEQGGFSMSDVIRATTYITQASYFDEVVPALGEAFGEIRPAASVVVCGLIKPEMKVEIEVTALRRSA